MKLTKQNGTDVSRRQIQPIYKGFQKNNKKRRLEAKQLIGFQ